MTERLESSADAPRRGRDAPRADERLVPTEVEEVEDLPAPAADGALAPAEGQREALQEIARAFRMNAEALQTLKQMQVDLTRTVERGDRSELVLQSTRALNDTFRNLSSVQRELLTRLDARHGGRGPLIPLMILGLLVVVVGGVYVILDAVQESANRKPQVDPAVIARRERDSWKEGRREGAQQAEREVQRLEELLDDSQGRTRQLEVDLQAKLEALGEIDRGKRAAELERDQFASQVRKAQGEVLAKQALEEEVASLRAQLAAANREALDRQVDLDRQRRLSAHLRDRMADYGMDIPVDDPPYRGPPPGEDAPEGDDPAQPAAARGDGAARPRNLLTAGRDGDADGGPPLPSGRGTGAGVSALPPPVLRRRTPLDTNAAEIQRVRTALNRLLDASAGPAGESWQVTRIDGVAQDRLGGVIVLHYDSAGRLLDSVEARDLRITVDKDERTVAFDLVDGVRVRRNERTPLPAQGTRIVVAKGDVSRLWAGSGLTMIKKR